MKFASVPSWDIALVAPNCLVTMTPIEPAKLVTNAIIKKSANITIIARMFPFFLLI